MLKIKVTNKENQRKNEVLQLKPPSVHDNLNMSNKEIHVNNKTLASNNAMFRYNACPVTGAYHYNPVMPTEYASVPTQVSDQHEQHTDEVVFSNGRSMKVDHPHASSNNPVTNTSRPKSPNAENTFHEHALYYHQQQRPQNSQAQTYNVQQNVSRRRPKPPRYPEYTAYHNRLKSYARWSYRHPDPTALCNAGFFYTNQADLVRCYECGIGLKDFSYGDKPLNEHVRYSEDCQYLLEYLESEGLEHIKKKIHGLQSGKLQRNVQNGNTVKPEVYYRHPEYRSYQARLSSFSKWPQRLMQSPHQLAEAGLYYTGFEDQVRCFACDGGLVRWDPKDDPWTEHCRWFPKCPYAVEQKGDAYICLVQSAVTMGNEDDVAEENNATGSMGNNGNDIVRDMDRLTLRDSELRDIIKEHRATCIEMGYTEIDFNEAVKILGQSGLNRPTLEDLLDAFEAGTRAQTLTPSQESPVDENRRLKSLLFCMACGIKEVNALFLPCTHHRMCVDCAEPLTQCPVCDRHITQKVKTFMS